MLGFWQFDIVKWDWSLLPANAPEAKKAATIFSLLQKKTWTTKNLLYPGSLYTHALPHKYTHIIIEFQYLPKRTHSNFSTFQKANLNEEQSTH